VSPETPASCGHAALIQLGGNGRVALSAGRLDLTDNRQHVGRKLPGGVFDDDIAQNARLSHLGIAEFLSSGFNRRHKSDPCLSVLIDDDGVFFNCKNCGYKGGKSYDAKSKSGNMVRKSGDLSGGRRTFGDLCDQRDVREGQV
jgi:hypothetical protein